MPCGARPAGGLGLSVVHWIFDIAIAIIPHSPHAPEFPAGQCNDCDRDTILIQVVPCAMSAFTLNLRYSDWEVGYYHFSVIAPMQIKRQVLTTG